MWSVGATLVCVVCALHKINASPELDNLGQPFDAYLEITVSAAVTETSIRVLNIAWKYPNYNVGDWIALYKAEPQSLGSEFLFKSKVGSREGSLPTGIMENRTYTDAPVFKKSCLGYYAAYWRNDSGPGEPPVLKNCLSSNPTWMEDNWDAIKDVPLNKLFFPGSHDAGAYQLAYRPFVPSRFQKYVFAQDESVLDQLIHGVRYLDFRIARYPSGFWLNHDIVRVHILEFLIEEIKTFMNNTSHEIVIIDAHNFPVGFSKRPGSHVELVDFLRQRLGSHMCRFLGYDSTLEQIRKTGKRVIFAYNDRMVASRYPTLLWQPVQQQWGNKKTISALQDFIRSLLDKPIPRLSVWSIMAELTPDVMMVLTDKLGGLRNMADKTNVDVTQWFFGSWGQKVNVVAVDFVRSSGIVSAAIRKNLEKYELKRQKRSIRKIPSGLVRTYARSRNL